MIYYVNVSIGEQTRVLFYDSSFRQIEDVLCVGAEVDEILQWYVEDHDVRIALVGMSADELERRQNAII